MPSLLARILFTLIGGSLVLVLGLALLVYSLSFHPDDVQPADLACPVDTPELPAGSSVRALNWNVQYMASTNYVFWYDIPNNAGPDERPSKEDVLKTIPEVARVIKEENPDIVLLQEMQEDSVQSHHINTVEALMNELGDAYPCRAEVFYWKAGFVPVPQIMGHADMKLVTLSKYKIASATRYALPLIPADPVSQQLGLKRAVLAAEIAVAGGAKPLMALNTHLSAFAQGTDTLDRQVEVVKGLLDGYTGDGLPWLIAGDFNMLPPGIDPNALDEQSRVYYNPRTEITPLFDAFSGAPSLTQATGPNKARYYTHIANHNKDTIGADRTIDYYFYGGLTLGDFRVRTADTGHISDHLPMIADFNL